MTLALGCIADDYTGASDLANTLTRSGLRTVQTIGVPSDDLELPEVDAVVVSLKSRSIEANLAVSRSRAAEKWLRGRGAGHVLFKICSTFDSTDAGNIGPVMDALRGDSGDAIVLVTPAFPETGRTVYQGNLFVGSVPLNESPLKDHPLNPMHDSNLVRVLARQSKTKVGLIDLADIARGPDAVRARLADLSRKGIGAAIADAVFERDLETIGKVALDHRVSVGASGLGLGLARALVASRRVNSNAPSTTADAPVGGPAACLAGSCSQATLQQIANAEKRMAVLHLDPDQIVAGKEEARRALAWARERLNEGPVLIASSSTPDQVAALQARHGREAAGHA
ncbi:MAG: serine kinase, partial [Bradyrhizobium sp.]|nr:serine kinase [Bradyrhizobium sp.]